MITLVGTLHSDVRSDPGELENVLASTRFDHLFTEGMSGDTINQELTQNTDQILSGVEDELGGAFSQASFEYMTQNLQQGAEPDYIENEVGVLEPEDATFLDNPHSLEQSIYTIKEHLSAEIEGTRPVKGISKQNLEQKLITENASRDDFMDYFRHLRDQGVKDFHYTAISYPTRFHGYKQELSADFVMNGVSDVMENLDMHQDRYQKEFLQGFQDYDISRFDFQEVIDETRDHEFQDPRDQRWCKQIDEYLHENPSDDVLVICGLNHVTDTENTLRRNLEDEYSFSQVRVKPFDYDKFRK